MMLCTVNKAVGHKYIAILIHYLPNTTDISNIKQRKAEFQEEIDTSVCLDILSQQLIDQAQHTYTLISSK